jgi:hypothetical protein
MSLATMILPPLTIRATNPHRGLVHPLERPKIDHLATVAMVAQAVGRQTGDGPARRNSRLREEVRRTTEDLMRCSTQHPVLEIRTSPPALHLVASLPRISDGRKSAIVSPIHADRAQPLAATATVPLRQPLPHKARLPQAGWSSR